MKSQLLLCMLLSLPVSCSSASDSEKTPESPVSDAPKSEDVTGANSDASAKAAEAELKTPGEADKINPEADAKLADSLASEAAPEAATSPAESMPEPAIDQSPVEAAPARAEAAPAESGKIVYPKSARLNVRRGPGKRFGIAHVIKFGQTISLSGERKKSWLKTTDGLWVSARYVSEKKPAHAKHAAARKKKAAAAKIAKAKSKAQAPAAAPAPAAAEATPAAVETAAPIAKP